MDDGKSQNAQKNIHPQMTYMHKTGEEAGGLEGEWEARNACKQPQPQTQEGQGRSKKKKSLQDRMMDDNVKY
jgi:hypothetical protein